MNARELFDSAFSVPRDTRSDEYKAGCMAAIKCGCNGVSIPLPYKLGSAQADAWFAGQDEGKLILREHGLPLIDRAK